MTERSASSSKVVVGSKAVMPSTLQVSIVRMVMVAPKSTKALGKEQPFIWTVTMGFPGLHILQVSLCLVINQTKLR